MPYVQVWDFQLGYKNLLLLNVPFKSQQATADDVNESSERSKTDASSNNILNLRSEIIDPEEGEMRSMLGLHDRGS